MFTKVHAFGRPIYFTVQHISSSILFPEEEAQCGTSNCCGHRERESDPHASAVIRSIGVGTHVPYHSQGNKCNYYLRRRRCHVLRQVQPVLMSWALTNRNKRTNQARKTRRFYVWRATHTLRSSDRCYATGARTEEIVQRLHEAKMYSYVASVKRLLSANMTWKGILESNSWMEKIPCPRCGKFIRPRSTHKNPNGLECSQYKDNSAQPSIHFATSSNHDLSQITGQDESHQSTGQDESHQSPAQDESHSNAVLEAMLQSLKEYLMQGSPECSSAYAEACRKQVRIATYREKIPCGICRTDFEVLVNQALYRHLKLHFVRLQGKHRCEICMINFVHDGDLQRHITCAQKGNCGFSFPHTTACGGLHPPTSGKCNNRTSFEITIRDWELSQLVAYIISIRQSAIIRRFSRSSTDTARSY